MQSAIVYGAAKSRQDLAAALAVCTPDFTIETVPFETVARGADEVAYDLRVFFALFPDYAFLCEGAAESADGKVCAWGRARMTWSGRLPATLPGARWLRLPRRSIDVPATAVYDVRDGLLARERFVFDMRAFCAQLGMPAPIVLRMLQHVQRKRVQAVRGAGRAGEIVVENSAIVNAPIERVFERGYADVTALLAGNLSFPESARAIRLVGANTMQVGAIRRVELDSGFAMDEVIEACEAPRLLSYRIDRFSPRLAWLVAAGRGTHELEAIGNATRVTWRAHVTPRSAWTRPLAKLVATRLLDRIQRRFHASLEARATR